MLKIKLVFMLFKLFKKKKPEEKQTKDLEGLKPMDIRGETLSEKMPPEETRIEKKEMEDLEQLKALDVTSGMPVGTPKEEVPTPVTETVQGGIEATELPEGVSSPVFETEQKEVETPKELIDITPPEEIEVQPEIKIPEEELPPPVETPEEVETPHLPETKARRTEIEFEEIPLKELCTKIKNDLKNIKKHIRSLGKLDEIKIDSQDMMDLLDIYMYARSRLQEFTLQINEMNLDELHTKKTLAAIYKFRACKLLSKIKEQVLKIEDVCKEAGFIPSKIHEILELKAETLINSFIKKPKK